MTGKEMIDDLRAELKQALEVRAACNMFAFTDTRAKIYADAGREIGRLYRMGGQPHTLAPVIGAVDEWWRTEQ